MLVKEKVIRLNLKHNICTHYQFTVYVDCLGTLYNFTNPSPASPTFSLKNTDLEAKADITCNTWTNS